MRAVVRRRYGPPRDVLQVVDLPVPDVGDDQALVRVEAVSLNTADSEYVRGVPLMARIAYGLRRPRSVRVGLDIAGTVEAVGEGVTGIGPGDEVWADLFSEGQGALAESVVVRAAALAPKPATASFEEAAAVPHSGVLALQALTGRGPIRASDHVLVNGAGGCVGPFAVQIAKADGAEVTAVDHTAKLDVLRAAGADHVLDHTRVEVTEGPDRFDVVLDIVGNRSLPRWRRCLRPGGRYVRIARSIGGFVAAAAVGGGISLVGDRRLGNVSWRPNRRADLDRLARLIDSGAITPLRDRERFGLDTVVDAFERLEAGRARGKVIVLPRNKPPG